MLDEEECQKLHIEAEEARALLSHAAAQEAFYLELSTLDDECTLQPNTVGSNRAEAVPRSRLIWLHSGTWVPSAKAA